MKFSKVDYTVKINLFMTSKKLNYIDKFYPMANEISSIKVFKECQVRIFERFLLLITPLQLVGIHLEFFVVKLLLKNVSRRDGKVTY